MASINSTPCNQVAILTQPAAFTPEHDEAGSRIVRAKAAAAVAAVASSPGAQTMPRDARAHVLTKGLAPLLATEPEGHVRRALSKAQAVLLAATAAEAEAEAEAFRAAVLGADKMTQTEMAAAALAKQAAPTAAGKTSAGPLEEDTEMEVAEGDGEDGAVLPLVKEGAERLDDDDKEEGGKQQQQQQEEGEKQASGKPPSSSPTRTRGRSRSASRSRSRSYSSSRGRSYSRSRSRSYSRVSADALPARSDWPMKDPLTHLLPQCPTYSQSASYSRSRSRGRSYSRVNKLKAHRPFGGCGAHCLASYTNPFLPPTPLFIDIAEPELQP